MERFKKYLTGGFIGAAATAAILTDAAQDKACGALISTGVITDRDYQDYKTQQTMEVPADTLATYICRPSFEARERMEADVKAIDTLLGDASSHPAPRKNPFNLG